MAETEALDVIMTEEEALDALSELLSSISANPYDLSLHAQHIQIAHDHGMDEQAMDARRLLTSYWAAADNIWLPMVDYRTQQGEDTLEDALEIHGLLQRAEEDYLSIPLLQKHIKFLIDRHNFFSGPKRDQTTDAFSTQWARAMLTSTVNKGALHLTQGHLLWDARLNWELEQLEGLKGEERQNLIIDIEDMILDRLKEPHSNHDQTFQAYSTFTTMYKPPDSYETLLVSASKLRAQAVKVYEHREKNETRLSQSNFSPEAYDQYINYERRAKHINVPILSMLYERAIADVSRLRFLDHGNAEAALRLFWTGYCDVLRTNTEDAEVQLAVFRRAIRSVPGASAVWTRYIRHIESNEADINALVQSSTELYEQAMATGLIQKDVEDIVPLVMARASLLRRAIMENDNVEIGVEALLQTLEEGIAMTRSTSKQGDPRYRLEKFLADIYVDLAQSPELASTVWESAARHFKSNYLPWTRYLDSLVTLGQHDQARLVYKEIVAKYIDWPEVIFDSWQSFENLHGDLDQLQECLDRIDRAQSQLNVRRAKEAAKTAHEASQAMAQTQVVTSTTRDAREDPTSLIIAAQDGAAMDMDKTERDNLRKRKHDEPVNDISNTKKAKTEAAAQLKRDRENCTVFISELPAKAYEQDIKALFKDCGDVREIKITDLPKTRLASVEFFDRDSVPAALTKDKKRIDGHEIAVHLAWKSTLYVTNFPEKADDSYIRNLFNEFGTLVDVRWPSKKFKASRRFCYVQFTSPDEARAAISLHGRELEPGIHFSVSISDPERKKERTDAKADSKEIYVAGLSKFVTVEDLKKLFKTYGDIKDVRMETNESGLPKGYAFVEFENEASAQGALQANNHDLKNRRIAVTMSDSRIRSRKREETASGLGRVADAKNRSIRIRGLPPSTQEGLLQQALEKYVVVKRLEVFQDTCEAIAELETAADAGKLLLLPEPIKFGDQALELSEELLDRGAKRSAHTAARVGDDVFIPRAANRPRTGLGSKRTSKKPSTTQISETANGQELSASGSKGQDDFRKLLD